MKHLVPLFIAGTTLLHTLFPSNVSNNLMYVSVGYIILYFVLSLIIATVIKISIELILKNPSHYPEVKEELIQRSNKLNSFKLIVLTFCYASIVNIFFVNYDFSYIVVFVWFSFILNLTLATVLIEDAKKIMKGT